MLKLVKTFVLVLQLESSQRVKAQIKSTVHVCSRVQTKQVHIDRTFSFNMFKEFSHFTQENRTVLLADIWADLEKEKRM